jgi:hypothetical protein
VQLARGAAVVAQGQLEAGLVGLVAGKRAQLQPAGAAGAPDGGGEVGHERTLELAGGGELGEQPPGHGAKGAAVLAVVDGDAGGAQAVAQRVARGARLAHGGDGSRRAGTVVPGALGTGGGCVRGDGRRRSGHGGLAGGWRVLGIVA